MEIQEIKQRFGIIGNSPLLNRAINIANQVAPTDISVLITGESGSGKEVFSHIIHQMSPRKHGPFIAVNCGAIPEGTIDSELFGHEKGAYTGAVGERKGYFETVNGGTIFLDEIAEMPLGTQARLLRVLESGQYIKVGSSKVEKTNVRVIAATNVDVYEAVRSGRFREDLYYRLNTVPLRIPPLRDRKEDIYLLFRKFTSDFTDKYRTPPIQMDDEAQQILVNYSWPGNVRQLKNMAEQLAVLETNHIITGPTLLTYIPHEVNRNLPMRLDNQPKEDFSERDILYKVLFDMKRDMVELKKLVADMVEHGGVSSNHANNAQVLNQLYRDIEMPGNPEAQFTLQQPVNNKTDFNITHDAEEVEESLSLIEKESDLIRKALKKHKGKRKLAANELGISERTLYRKIKELDL
jgi:transcriptional regulator with PAS, ATPase and Fis domain